MGMEHVHARIFVAEFQNAALGLPLYDRVCEFAGDKAGAGGVVVEKIGVQMKRVDQVELEDIDQINTYLLADADLDRMVLVMERDPIDRVEVIGVVEIDIDAVHDHDHFAVDGRTSLLGVDNEGTVKAFCDMTSQRKDMTVIKMQAKWLRIEFVGETASRFYESAGPGTRDPVHVAGMETMEMHGMWMVASVAKLDTDSVAFCGTKRWTGDPAVIGPGRELDPWDNLNVFIERDDLVLAQGLSIRQSRYFAPIEIGQNVRWIEPVLLMVHLSNGARQIAMSTLLHNMRCVHLCRMICGMVMIVLCERCGSGCAQNCEPTYLEKI